MQVLNIAQNLSIQTIIDDSHGQYLLYNNTWSHEKRYYGCFLHLEVHNNAKIWIHHDGTELLVAEKLLESGVPKQDIVLGFQPPSHRSMTDFAVA